MSEPNVVGRLVAYGEMELTKAADRPAAADNASHRPVDAEQEEE